MQAVYAFKLVLLGESAVGKSSIVFRFVRNKFSAFQEPTIGAAFVTQTVVLDNCQVKFECWDTAGQERYISLAPMYYRGAPAAIVVYDITDYNTFTRAKVWVDELHANGAPGCVIALAGNKVDQAERRKVSYEEAMTYAVSQGLIFMETSAKTNINVAELFREIAIKVPKNDVPSPVSTDTDTDSINKIEPVKKDDKKKNKRKCAIF